jgi:2-polyprenyl-6-methoxyphenol hydroxylase-like FAD-dependent oxidoreductase
VKALSEVAEGRGVKIIYGCQITDVDEACPAVHFEDGSVMEADLIVGADGKISSRPEVS